MASMAFLPFFCSGRDAYSGQDATPCLCLLSPLQPDVLYPLFYTKPHCMTQERQNFLSPGTQNHKPKFSYGQGRAEKVSHMQGRC